MRCKNCGSLNEDGRYICQNCGSPLFDEEDQLPENVANAETGGAAPEDDGGDDENNKKSIIIIIVLSVILIALIAGIAVSAIHNKRDNNETETTSISEEASEEESTTKKETTTTTTTTEKETTTETTTTTTTSTTKAKENYSVTVNIDGNGTVYGEGTYVEGDNVTLTATPAEGYDFSGWYDNSTGNLVANSTTFKISSIDKNTRLTARFTEAATLN